MSAVTLDPLITEAKRRARQRRLLGLVAAIAVAGVAIAAYSVVRPDTGTPSVSIPAAATGRACGVRGVGAQILSPRGQTLYREPGGLGPINGFPAIQCGGSTIWAVWVNGAGMMQEAYLGARSSDGGRTWNLVFTEGMYGPKAPHHLDSYLGVWTLRGSRDAYFVGSCPACSERGIGITNALFVTTNGGRRFARLDVPELTGYTVTGIRVRGRHVILRAKRFIPGIEPPRKTVEVRVA